MEKNNRLKKGGRRTALVTQKSVKHYVRQARRSSSCTARRNRRLWYTEGPLVVWADPNVRLSYYSALSARTDTSTPPWTVLRVLAPSSTIKRVHEMR